MEYIVVIAFIGLMVGFIIYRRKKQIRLLNELQNSKLLKDLLKKGFKQIDKKTFSGNCQEYNTGFYYKEDARADLIGYATIDCAIPFVNTKGGVKKMMAFSKKYRSSGFAIDSRTGFCKELKVDFLLNSNNGEIFEIFDEMVSVAKKEGFDSIK